MHITAIQNSPVYTFGKENKTCSLPSFTSKNTTEIRGVNIPYTLSSQTEDNQYRCDILRAFGLDGNNQYRIKSIMGANETRETLKELEQDENNFIASDENIETGKFKANLHIHTTASDGYFTAEKLLNAAAEYGDKVKEKTGKPFVIAVTDHDSIDSYENIVKEVYKKPDKYKNLKIILGMESTTFDTVDNKPMQFHMHVYNINPADKKFNDFLRMEEDKKQQLSEFVIDNLNKDYQNTFESDDNLLTYKEFTDFYPTMKKRILSTHNYLRNYSLTKFMMKEVVVKNPLFDNYFKETNPEKDIDIEMMKLKQNQYLISHNNKGETPYSSIIEYYSPILGIEKEELEQSFLEQVTKDKKTSDFIKRNNYKMLNHKNINGQNFYVSIDEVYNALSEQPQATLGIAHPLSTTLDLTNESNFDSFTNILYKKKKSNNMPYNTTPEFLENFYKRFKEAGREKAAFSERYYQSYSTAGHGVKNQTECDTCIDKMSQNLNLIKTGGYDTHREDIFKRYW